MYIYGVGKTPKILAGLLNCKSGLRLTKIRRNGIILNWGRYIPDNCRFVINRNLPLNKYKVLDFLSKKEILTPPLFKAINKREGIHSYPIFGRNFKHSKGRDIEIINNKEELYNSNKDFFTLFINKEGEYRTHYLFGEVVNITKKKLADGEEGSKYIWNTETGYKHIEYRKEGYMYKVLESVTKEIGSLLKVDFGALDFVVLDSKPYFLEINFAPCLEGRRLETYTENIKLKIKNYE